MSLCVYMSDMYGTRPCGKAEVRGGTGTQAEETDLSSSLPEADINGTDTVFQMRSLRDLTCEFFVPKHLPVGLELSVERPV